MRFLGSLLRYSVLFIQLKLRQAQEVIRISAKYDIDPLKEEFNRWCAGDIVVGRNPTVFHLLMSRFREMKGTVELDNVEKEFRYTKEYMGLSKDKATVLTEEFQNTKSRQEENVIEMYWYFYLSIYTASPPLGDYVQVRISAVLVEEMLLKIKSSHKIC